MAKIEEVTSAEGDITSRIQAVLKKVELARRDIKKGKKCPGADPSDIRAIVSGFNTPEHTISYLALSTVVSFLRENCVKDNVPAESQTVDIARLFYAEMDEGMRATTPHEITQAINLNDVLLQVDPPIGAHIFLRDGMREWLEDIPELFPSSEIMLWRRTTILLSLASGVAACRPTVKHYFQSWLQLQSRTAADMITRSSAAVALTKLSRAVGDAASPQDGLWNTGVSGGGQKSDEEDRQRAAQDAELTSLMKGLVISESGTKDEDQSPVMDAVEGLAYLSAEQSLKKSLSDDTAFLEHLFSLVPTSQKHNNLIARQIDDAPTAKTSTALTYGIAVVICNLVSYPPRLTDEEAQFDKLRRMARPGAASASGHLQDPDKSGEQVRETDEAVALRGKKLIKAGVLPVLAGLVKSAETGLARITIAKCYLALVEPKENRGQILQNGGAKALAFLSRAGSLQSKEGGDLEPLLTNDRAADFRRRSPTDLIPIQALAKLAITTKPQLLFGTSDQDIIDAIQPFHFLVLYPDSSLLQRFEALMALTNLASVSATAADRVATTELASKLEMLMLDDNMMVRRAAVELVCNLITTDTMLPRYGGVPTSDSPMDEKAYLKASPAPAVISRVHVLLGLSDVEDIKTQLAASGALATLLSISPAACKALLSIKKGPAAVFAILGDIVHPNRIVEIGDDESNDRKPAPATNDPGELLQLAHRGVVCVWSLLSCASVLEMEAAVVKAADEEKIAAALVALIKPLMASEARNTPGPRQIIVTSAQALKWLNDRGIEVRT